MNEIMSLFTAIADRMKQLAKGNAVVAQTISVGERHVIPLCELRLGCGGFGGQGSGMAAGSSEPQGGTGGGAAGGAKAQPVAVVVIEDGQARIEHLK